MKGIVHAELFKSDQLLAVRDAENFITLEGRNTFLNAFFKNINIDESSWGIGVYLLGDNDTNPEWKPIETDTWDTPTYQTGILFNYDNIVLASYSPTSVTAPEITSDMLLQFDVIPPDDGLLTNMNTISGIFLVTKVSGSVKLISAVLFTDPIIYEANTELRIKYTIYL